MVMVMDSGEGGRKERDDDGGDGRVCCVQGRMPNCTSTIGCLVNLVKNGR